MFEGPLDYPLISDDPFPVFMGELPRAYEDIPAKVVVNLCGVYPLGEPFGRTVLSMPLLDALEPELCPSRENLERFLDAVHHYASTEASYWHCHAGINRSGLALAAYLHRHRGLRIGEAVATMRARRSPMVLCNSLFEGQLRNWYGRPEEKGFEPFNMDRYLSERTGSRDDWR